MMSALLMKSDMADKVVAGELEGEIRKMKCSSKVGTTVYIAKCGTKTLIGTVKVEACKELSYDEAKVHPWSSMCRAFDTKNTKPRYEWLFSNPVKFDKPISYEHPRGAQIWVNLPK